MSSTLEYQFEVDLRKGIRKSEKIVIKTERMPYETALRLSNELNRKGIHYKIKEFDLWNKSEKKIKNRELHCDVYTKRNKVKFNS